MGTSSSLSFYFCMQSSSSLPLALSHLAFAHHHGRLSRHQFHRFLWFPLILARLPSSPLFLTPPYSFYKPTSFISSCLKLMYLWVLLTPPPLTGHLLIHSCLCSLSYDTCSNVSHVTNRIILTLCILQLPPYLFSPFLCKLQLSSFACLSFIHSLISHWSRIWFHL